MLIDKVVICNWALNELGHYTTYSIDGEDELSGKVDLCWQQCVDRCLSVHDWNDFLKTFKLARSAETPENGWTYEFALPGGRVGEPLKILDRAGSSPNPLRHYDREGNYVYADVTDVWARCKVYRDPEYWDPGWRSAFLTALSGYLAGAILQDKKTRDEKIAEAFGTPSQQGGGGMFGRLMAQDRAGAPVGSPIQDANPLTGGRSSDYGWWGQG